MEFNPKEISAIEEIGRMHGKPVKLIKFLGGFHLAVGNKSVNSKKTEPLAAGSHEGIVKYQVEKQFKNNFQPALQKSECSLPSEIVRDKSNCLSKAQKDEGLEIYSLQNNNDMSFVINRHGTFLSKHEYCINNNNLEWINAFVANISDKIDIPELAKSLGSAIMSEAKRLKLKEIVR